MIFQAIEVFGKEGDYSVAAGRLSSFNRLAAQSRTLPQVFNQYTSNLALRYHLAMKAATDPLSIALRAIAEPSRRKILQFIENRKEANASEVEARIKLAQPTISHHLRVLTKANLILTRKQGTFVIYSRNKPAIDRLRSELREL